MIKFIWTVIVLGFPAISYATPQIASDAYVQNELTTRVSTTADANQDMQGTYTVSGTLLVPTQPLPANEIVQ